MNRCPCHTRPRCHCHHGTWWAFGLILIFPLWLAFWIGREIHARWGKTGAWIYFGAWCIAGGLHNTIGDPNVPPPPSPVVVTVTTTVTPNP